MVAGVEALKERIRQRANEEAQGFIAEAEQLAAETMAKATAKAEKERADILAAAESEAGERKRRTLAMAAMQARRLELKVKEEIIDEAFALAVDNLKQLPAEKYQELIRPMLLAAVETGVERVVIAPEDKKRIDAGFINAINRELKAQGRVGELELAKETRPLTGGFILSADGVENNYSFELILKLSRDELEQEVAGILFPAS